MLCYSDMLQAHVVTTSPRDYIDIVAACRKAGSTTRHRLHGYVPGSVSAEPRVTHVLQ